MGKYTPQELASFGLDAARIPRHVAIIMDGNGRWAKQRGLPRAMGHRAGVNALREIIRFSSDAGVEALTLYAFSTENRKRPKDEIGVLCGLLIEYINREIDELDANAVRIQSIGELDWFPQGVQDAVTSAERRTAQNAGLKLNIALNYGAYAEMERAMQLACVQATQEERPPTRADFEANLYTAGLPQLDLLIRTSGEQRISNFLLYQLAYAELYFTDVYWPDFTREEYCKALTAFGARSRRFGGLNDNADIHY